MLAPSPASTASSTAPSASTPAAAAWASAAEGCAHCGLPLPAGAPHGDFCCTGCASVHALLLDETSRSEFDLVCEVAGARPASARPSGRDYAEFDDPAFHRLYMSPRPGGLGVRLYAQGVHCGACLWLIERAALRLPGVLQARVDLGRSVLDLAFDPTAIQLSAIARAVDACGYSLHPFRGAERAALHRMEDRALLMRMGVAGAVAGNVMLIAVALYSGAFSGMEAEYRGLFQWASLIITMPSMLYSASIFYRGAFASLRTRTPHMDLPVALGLSVGFVSGAINTAVGHGEIYFDTITVLIFALLVGRYLQQRQRRAAASAAELLLSLRSAVVRVVEVSTDSGQETTRSIPQEALAAGALLEVLPGETLPADGVVESGTSSLDASWLTGESRPQTVEPGARVLAGTINLASPLRLRAERTGEETRMAGVLRLVDDAARRRAPVVALADRVAGWFVLAMIAVSALAFAAWWFIDSSRVVDVVVALLVVTCPCALGMATPLAVSVALGRAARAGMLVKGGEVIENLARPAVIYFDKTGTLTRGKVEVVERTGPEWVWPLVAALEQSSTHPVGRALAAYPPDSQHFSPPITPDEPPTHQVGGGVTGRVAGHKVSVGTRAFVEQHQTTALCPPELQAQAQHIAQAGHTPVFVAVDGHMRALAACGDTLRPESGHAVAQLQSMGFEVRLLSGDHPAAVAEVARHLGLAHSQAEGAANPERKLAVIEQSARERATWMVGDGVNDAAALSAAHVGVGVHGGAEASLQAAHVHLSAEGLHTVVRLAQGARRTMKVIRRNIQFSLLYNLMGASLALAGVLGPLGAAVLMPLSSITVILSSSRARTFEQSPPNPTPTPRTTP